MFPMKYFRLPCVGRKSIGPLVKTALLALALFELFRLWRGWQNQQKSVGVINRCPPPSLDVWNKDIVPFYQPSVTPNCSKEFNPGNYSGVVAFTLEKGNRLKQLVKLDLHCCYRTFWPQYGKFSISKSCSAILNETTEIPSDKHYIAVECSSSPGEVVVYRDAFPLVHRKPKQKVQTKSSEPEQLNVLIIGLDGVSRHNFIRHMPQSNKYLLQELSAVSLEGYSIVGRGTYNNLAPMLVGFSLREMKKCMDSQTGYDFNVNAKCSFIWQEYSKMDYLTTFAEDREVYTLFLNNMSAVQPTDYYLRPFYLYMNQFSQHLSPKRKCFGPRLSLEVILNFVEAVRKEAKRINRPHFQLFWNGRLGHNGLNEPTGDEDATLVKYFKHLNASGAMQNTVIMLIGDHGNMLTGYHDTPSGHLEYRFPLGYIVLPPFFRQQFPREYQNLLDNRKVMTTAYDIHKTLQHIQNLSNWQQRPGRGFSLFTPIPKNRRCLEAGISLKWCNICHPKVPLKVDDPLIGLAANYVISTVNEKTLFNRSLCAEQTLRNVSNQNMELKWDYRDISLECKQHGNLDVGVTDFEDPSFKAWDINCNVNDTVDIVNVEVTTNPSGAVYHGEVLMAWKVGKREAGEPPYKLELTDELLRKDLYYKTGNCTDSKHIQPYCICK